MSSIPEEMSQLRSDMKLSPVDYHKRIKPRETLTITIVGERGSGKSLFMCILAYFYQVANKTFYTNFGMNETLTNRKEFNIRNLFSNPNVEAIFLDEMHNIADQHSNNTLETQLLVSLFTQSRKRNQLLVFSTLKFYKLAKDLRHLTNIIVYPQYNKVLDYLDLTFWDFRNNKMHTKRWYHVSMFFNFYDTYEIIVSEKVKHQLSQYLLKHQKVKKEMAKELDQNEIELVEKLEEKMKDDKK